MNMVEYDIVVDIFKNKKIILLGENLELERFRDFNVVGIVCGGEENVSGIAVYDYQYLLTIADDTKIIIVDDCWEIEVQFEFNAMMIKLGLSLGADYIYSSMLHSKIDSNRLYTLVNRDAKQFKHIFKKIVGDRKVVTIYGNCQTHTLINMISSNKEFAEKYLMCDMPRLWDNEDKEKFVLMAESGILSMTDYFFTQDVRAENRFGYMASTEYMFSLVSEKCKCIKISNLYFMGYFPQLAPEFSNDTETMRVDLLGEKVFNTGKFIDHEVLKLITKGYSGEEIVSRISSDDYFDQQQLSENIELELERFAQREENIEIKMCDYLRDNYNKKCLFATANHPTTTTMLEFARRILNELGIADMDISCEEGEIQEPMTKGFYFVTYPSVLRAYDFKERRYVLHVRFRGCELIILKGLDAELDQFIEGKTNDQQGVYDINISLDFEKYMTAYVRILQSVLHV